MAHCYEFTVSFNLCQKNLENWDYRVVETLYATLNHWHQVIHSRPGDSSPVITKRSTVKCNLIRNLPSSNRNSFILTVIFNKISRSRVIAAKQWKMADELSLLSFQHGTIKTQLIRLF